MENSTKTPVILFDGVCNFCNGSVNFIIDRDKKGLFSFASLQSSAAQEILQEKGEDTASFNSVILVTEDKIYRKSRAALEIAKQLSGLWPIFYIFRIIPTSIRDFFYDIIAKNRYKWFGKRDTCRMPEPEVRERFLEVDA